MLTEIRIRNFAIVDEVVLEPGPGLTVLSGETGAGKSILVDALGLALGHRASAEVVRHGADRTEVTAVFELESGSAAAKWLKSHDLDADGECVVRRVVPLEGRSRAYVNGQPVPAQALKALGRRLMDIHGQHEHQSLTRRDMQRQLLDTLGGCQRQLAAVAGAYSAWRDLQDEYERLSAASASRDARIDLLKYQVGELDALGLGPDELAELETEHRRTANTERLSTGVAAALDSLYERETGSAQELLGSAARLIRELARIDAGLDEAAELVAGAEIQASEAADALRRYLDGLETDPGRAAWLQDRIGTAHELARKHRIKPPELPAHTERMRAELDQLENADSRLAELARELEAARKACGQASDRLSARRTRAARELSGRIQTVMQGLGMPDGVFDVRVERAEPPVFSAHGVDTIVFNVSANPGQPPQPLGRVASGGELSRISLAIQVVAAGAAPVPSMVFDEVDAGVGGGVAQIVGEQLRRLGEFRQVLCVTHLPQVASQANAQFRVSKLTDGKTTRTTIASLDETQRVEELARMLGGVKITGATRAHAREMIEHARK